MLRWNEHFKEVLNREDININNNQNIIPPNGDPLNINMEPITEDEIIKAIKRLKNGKSPGIDSITAEVLKVDIETTTKVMHKLFQQIWNHEIIPNDWAKGIIIKLPKKGDLSDCNNWRGVTLLSVPSKIFLRVLLNRIDKSIDAKLREEQAGFRPNRGCIDHIFTIRNILEQCIEWNSKLILNFVDFQNAFDSVNRESIWQTLAAYGIPAKIITLIKAFYNNYEFCVLNNGQQSEWFKVNTGSGKDS